MGLSSGVSNGLSQRVTSSAVRIARSDADPGFRSITEALRISPNGLRARVIRPKTAQVYSMRLSRQISRFLQLRQIFPGPPPDPIAWWRWRAVGLAEIALGT